MVTVFKIITYNVFIISKILIMHVSTYNNYILIGWIRIFLENNLMYYNAVKIIILDTFIVS